MNWVQRKIFLYNVTFGLYMLDWWERLLFRERLSVLVALSPFPSTLPQSRFYNSKHEFLYFGNLNASRWSGACVNVVRLPKRGSSYIRDLQKLS